uniref:RanBD1 domain-containing protein n=1 Tax=Panagrolaimus sp. PS1159 TaxID=55785 RepID=A0AC35FT21_9BILA
ETKEVKERGVGDLKVLYNPEKKNYRAVMRREQVHKICANFRITKGMNFADKAGTKGCGMFSCIDFSENPQKGTSTLFYARFREENVYEEFKKLFNEIAEGNHPQVSQQPPKPTATVPKLPYIGDSNNPSVDVEADEDCGEENYDEETEVLLETDCKLILGEAYKSPLRKNKNEKIHENVKLVVRVADEGVYKVKFENGKDDPIFPHFIQNNTNYKKNGKNITFITRDHNVVRKSVKCEFKDAATAQKAFETLQECLESPDFQGDDDN